MKAYSPGAFGLKGADAESKVLRLADPPQTELLGDQQLQLKGQRNQVNVEAVSWHRRERETGQFERTFELPVAVNPDRVSAQFKNGVLLVTLPKREEAKARKVVIKTS